ncbi:MAG: FG-GAP-like repeat-containing protein, partial [Chitinophagaceae bacterium]|nr:FG-GAP-like repeat-containing protein [Chitinophagaceae bacterium]
MYRNILCLLLCFTTGYALFSQSLGSYPVTMLQHAGAQAIISPSAPPAGLNRLALTTPLAFKGTAAIQPATGNIIITNAYPAGNYTFLVKGIPNSIDTIYRTVQVTVGNATCSQAGFAPSLASSIPAYHYPLAVGNFNGDAHQDIVTISTTNLMSIRLGDRAGNFTAAGTSAVQADSRQIKVADINNDGHEDVLVANLGSNTVSVRLGDGAGNLLGTNNISVGTQPHDLVLADFNTDGHLDIATANFGSNNVSIRLGNSTGAFTNGNTFNAGTQPTNIITGDFNKDGNTDLAVTNGGSANVSVFLGNGAGGFSAAPTVSAGNGAVHLAADDFNADGHTDLAILNQTGNSISIRLGSGNGSFTNGATLTTGSGPRVVVAADFDGDGRPDLATVNSGSGNLSVFYGLGNGQFGHTRTIATSANALGLAVGDFNADGMHDLAALHQTASNNLRVFLGAAGQANITLQGNNADITNGSTTRSLANHTSFGTTSPVTRTYTIKNTGTQPLHVHQIAISGNDAALFTLGNITLPATIAAGSAVTFTVAFTSTTAGEKTAKVTVTNNDCDAGQYEFAIGANVAGVTGSALELDGTNDYINIPGFANYNFGGEFTMEAWILKRADKNGGRIIDKGTGGVNDGFILDDANNLRVIFTHQFISFGQVTVATDVTSPEPLPLNIWHHVAATFSNATKSVNLFVNGRLVATKAISNNNHTLRVNNLPLRIGTAAAGTAPYFQGRIDEVRLWSRALTLCEIQQRMNCQVKDTAAGLIANYHFDQGIARGDNATVTTLTDATGNNRNGALVNFGLNGGSSNWTGPGAVGNETFCAPTGTTPLSRIFVNAAATGNGNPKTGASWATAFDNLDDALQYLASNTACSTGTAPIPEIWIAGGTYKPVRDEYGTLNPTNGRLKTFLLNQPVSIYGGFKGNETNIAQYTPGTPTILSGDIGLPNDSADNAYHVVTALKDGLKNVTLYNLVITEGFASGNLTRNNIRSFYGGGLYNRGVELTLRNVVFHKNRSDDFGGALYNDFNAATRCEQVIFTQNHARNNGGAVAQSSGLASSYLHSVFYKNTTGIGTGAALFHQSASADDQPLFTNTIVFANRGTGTAISPLLNAGKATYSIMQDGGISGAGISYANPLFADSLLPAGPDGIWMTADDGLQPNACEAIDKGSNTASAAIANDIPALALQLINKKMEISRINAQVEAFFDEFSVPMKTAFQTDLILDEILTNIITHGYPQGGEHSIDLKLSIDNSARTVTITVADGGTPFDPTTIAEADTTSDLEERAIGGLGIHFVKQISQTMEYNYSNNKNIL